MELNGITGVYRFVSQKRRDANRHRVHVLRCLKSNTVNLRGNKIDVFEISLHSKCFAVFTAARRVNHTRFNEGLPITKLRRNDHVIPREYSMGRKRCVSTSAVFGEKVTVCVHYDVCSCVCSLQCLPGNISPVIFFFRLSEIKHSGTQKYAQPLYQDPLTRTRECSRVRSSHSHWIRGSARRCQTQRHTKHVRTCKIRSFSCQRLGHKMTKSADWRPKPIFKFL